MEINILIVITIITLFIIAGWEAINQVSWGKLRRLEAENNKKARCVENWLKNKSSYITVFRILLFFLVSIIASLVFEVSHEYLLQLLSFLKEQHNLLIVLMHVIPAIIITFVLIVLTESILRLFVMKYDIEVLTLVMPFIKFMNVTLLYPILLFIRVILKIIKRSHSIDEDKPSTEDEIMSLIDNNYNKNDDENSLEEDEKQMIKGVFELDDTIVREIMTPRVDVIALPIKAEIQEAIDLFIESGYSRIPVYYSTVDEISGIILAKDFLDKVALENKALEELVYKPIYIPETKSTLALLNEFKGSCNHFSVVIDEYGGTAGIITMEDILEEIVGEIYDEHETEEEIVPQLNKDGSAVIEARTLVDEIEELFSIKLPDNEDVDTIGGLVSAKFGRIPEPDEEINLENILKVKVLKADKRRVLTLKIKKVE